MYMQPNGGSYNGQTVPLHLDATQAAVYQHERFGQPGRGIPVTGRNGKLLPEVVQVMEICAENGMILQPAIPLRKKAF